MEIRTKILCHWLLTKIRKAKGAAAKHQFTVSLARTCAPIGANLYGAYLASVSAHFEAEIRRVSVAYDAVALARAQFVEEVQGAIKPVFYASMYRPTDVDKKIRANGRELAGLCDSKPQLRKEVAELIGALDFFILSGDEVVSAVGALECAIQKPGIKKVLKQAVAAYHVDVAARWPANLAEQ